MAFMGHLLKHTHEKAIKSCLPDMSALICFNPLSELMKTRLKKCYNDRYLFPTINASTKCYDNICLLGAKIFANLIIQGNFY